MIATSTEARSPRCIKAKLNGSSRYSTTMLSVPILYRHRPISDLEDHEVALVSLVQQLGREYLPGRAEGDDPPVEQEGEIESLRDAREVVCRHHDGRPPLLQTPQEVEDLMLRRCGYH